MGFVFFCGLDDGLGAGDAAGVGAHYFFTLSSRPERPLCSSAAAFAAGGRRDLLLAARVFHVVLAQNPVVPEGTLSLTACLPRIPLRSILG